MDTYEICTAYLHQDTHKIHSRYTCDTYVIQIMIHMRYGPWRLCSTIHIRYIIDTQEIGSNTQGMHEAGRSPCTKRCSSTYEGTHAHHARRPMQGLAHTTLADLCRDSRTHPRMHHRVHLPWLPSRRCASASASFLSSWPRGAFFRAGSGFLTLPPGVVDAFVPISVCIYDAS